MSVFIGSKKSQSIYTSIYVAHHDRKTNTIFAFKMDIFIHSLFIYKFTEKTADILVSCSFSAFSAKLSSVSVLVIQSLPWEKNFLTSTQNGHDGQPQLSREETESGYQSKATAHWSVGVQGWWAPGHTRPKWALKYTCESEWIEYEMYEPLPLYDLDRWPSQASCCIWLTNGLIKMKQE